jgi:hypothetical protein
MRKAFTRTERNNGELACRQLSELASRVYRTTDPLDIIEVVDESDNKIYFVRGCIEADNLTFDELDKLLTDFGKEIYN